MSTLFLSGGSPDAPAEMPDEDARHRIDRAKRLIEVSGKSASGPGITVCAVPIATGV